MNAGLSAYASRSGDPVRVSPRFDRLGFDDPDASFRLGIMGGTFDPIHVGHLACAEQVADRFGLDGVVFMPTGDPWMKHGSPVTAAELRYEMVHLAIEGNARFDASRLEIDRPGRTYTVDTLRELRAHFPENVELFFVSGADALFRILEWRHADELGRLAHLVGVTRPGFEVTDSRRRYMRTHAGIFRVSEVEVTALSISSTDLRRMVSEGRSVRYLVPREVFDFIRDRGLYRTVSR